MKSEIIEYIKADALYDYIANKYNQLTKEELRDLLLEYIYAVYKTGYNNSYIVIELLDRWGDLDNE